MNRAEKNDYWKDDLQHWYNQLNSSVNGLTDQAADEKLHHGPKHTRVPSRLEKDLRLFLGQFKNPLMLMLIGAVILSAYLGEASDVFIIGFILLSSGIMGFAQERNAGKVIETLQGLISIKNTILRGGSDREIPSNEVVSGDVVKLRAGDIVPADCLIIESNELHVNEASLSGESFPVRKEYGVLKSDTPLAERSNCVWQGSSIVSGSGSALVIKTGEETLFGSMVGHLNHQVETTFEKGIKDFGFFLLKITLILSIVILVINILFHRPVMESALFALALAVGMAPELLPAITTIAMARGAKTMLTKKVIVKKLTSIQNLGEIDLLCTDKTGTITEGIIQVDKIVDIKGNEDLYTRQLAYLNAKLETGYGNPIDDALRTLNVVDLDKIEKIGEIPYDFIRKRLSIAVEWNGEKVLICKGAIKQILEICEFVRFSNGEIHPIQDDLFEINKQFEQFSANGYRVLGVCYKKSDLIPLSKEVEEKMIFAGFVLLQDPVKKDILEIMGQLKKLNIDLKIITGDNRNVARHIGEQLGIDDLLVLTGDEIFQTSPEALVQKVKDAHIFAEIEPHQKARLIHALRQSHSVAYMGDGINDVEAINEADVGISVDNAVDVARQAADFVLLEKSLMVLVDGVKEGRKTFTNTMKYIFVNTSATFGNMFSMATISLFVPFLPMLPKQILLTNFLTDFPYLWVATDNVDREQIEKSGRWNLTLIRRYMLIFGTHSSVFDLITFSVLLNVMKTNESSFQTAWFLESVLTELCILMVIRTRRSFFKSRPSRALFWVSLLALVLTISIPYFPFSSELGFVRLGPTQIGAIALIVLSYVITADWLKIWFFKKYALVK